MKEKREIPEQGARQGHLEGFRPIISGSSYSTELARVRAEKAALEETLQASQPPHPPARPPHLSPVRMGGGYMGVMR
jgi:hypothetical protein